MQHLQSVSTKFWLTQIDKSIRMNPKTFVPEKLPAKFTSHIKQITEIANNHLKDNYQFLHKKKILKSFFVGSGLEYSSINL